MSLICILTASINVEFDIVGLIGVIVALYLGLKGFKKYSEYKESACYGYYIHLGFYIDRLKGLIYCSDNNPTAVWYFLSAGKDHEKKPIKEKGDQDLRIELKTFALEFVSYLCNAQNQVPPSDKTEWYNKMKTLNKYLIHFTLLDKDITYPEYDTE